VFIPQFLSFKSLFVSFLVNFFKNVLEPAIILLEDGIFGGQIKGVVSLKGVLEARVSEMLD